MASVNDVLIWSGSEWLSLEGPQGQAGQSATVDAGTTTTGAAGTDAEVENVGSTTEAVFNFTIPTGAQGPDGEAGTQQVGTVETNQLSLVLTPLLLSITVEMQQQPYGITHLVSSRCQR